MLVLHKGSLMALFLVWLLFGALTSHSSIALANRSANAISNKPLANEDATLRLQATEDGESTNEPLRLGSDPRGITVREPASSVNTKHASEHLSPTLQVETGERGYEGHRDDQTLEPRELALSGPTKQSLEASELGNEDQTSADGMKNSPENLSTLPPRSASSPASDASHSGAIGPGNVSGVSWPHGKECHDAFRACSHLTVAASS